MIYLFNCKTYVKQYTGKTTHHFRCRWNNYKSKGRKAEGGKMENVKQKFLQSHFLQPDHKDFIKDVEVRLIDKTQGSDPTKQKFYWMRTLNLFIIYLFINHYFSSNTTFSTYTNSNRLDNYKDPVAL